MTELLQGIVLKYQQSNDNDLFLVSYTREKGKVELFAKSAMKISSKLRSHMEIMNATQIMMAKGKNIDRLAGCYSLVLWNNLKKDYDKIISAMSLIECIDKMIEVGEPDIRIYDLLYSWLSFLNDNTLPKENIKKRILIWIVVLKLLKYLGFGPEVFKCTRCHHSIVASEHLFSIHNGGIVCNDCKENNDEVISVSALKVLRYCLDEKKEIKVILKDLVRMKVDNKVWHELEEIAKDFFVFFAGRDLKGIGLMQ